MKTKKPGEFQIALVVDDYKIPHKDQLWDQSFKQAPEVKQMLDKNYVLEREESGGVGASPHTTIFYRVYRLKQ